MKTVACRPCIGDPLPQTLDEFAGVVIFGGPMSANDDIDFIKQEIDWISVPLRENVPFLGICLGAQMLVKHLGGHVTKNPENFHEIGYYPIKATQAGKTLLDWPAQVYQWHSEGFSLPEDAVLLASGDKFTNQAFKYGDHAYGVQFHAEVTHWMMNRWTTKAAHKLVFHGAQSRETHFANRAIYDPEIRQWFEKFLRIWLHAPNSNEVA